MNYYKKTIKNAVEHINSDLNSYSIKPDIDYLISILNIRRYSKSKIQDEFVDSLERFYLEQGGITNRDTYGNLYVVKGDAELYPCMIAHTDINQTVRENVNIFISDDIMFGFDSDEAVQCGIGADDGCGIALAYEMFKRFDAIKLFFPKNEETSCLGSKAADISFFKDCSMLLQGDRRSYTTDLITYTNGIQTCSKEFVNAASEIMDKYGYNENRGVYTDVGQIKSNSEVDCIGCNISCGYFNEHSDEEVISIKAYYNATNFIYELIEKLSYKKWNHVHKEIQYDMFDDKPKRKSSYDLFDDIYYDSKKTELDSYNDSYNDPSKFKVKGYDDNYNDYVLEVYAQYFNNDSREKELRSYTSDGEDLKDWMTQSEIDDLLMDDLCPACLSDVEISNELLLNVNCHACSCTFNCTLEVDYNASFDTDSADNIDGIVEPKDLPKINFSDDNDIF